MSYISVTDILVNFRPPSVKTFFLRPASCPAMLASFPDSPDSTELRKASSMIPFDGKFAQNTCLPLATAAYDSQNPPAGYVANQTAFAIVADDQGADFKAQSAKS